MNGCSVLRGLFKCPIEEEIFKLSITDEEWVWPAKPSKTVKEAESHCILQGVGVKFEIRG